MDLKKFTEKFEGIYQNNTSNSVREELWQAYSTSPLAKIFLKMLITHQGFDYVLLDLGQIDENKDIRSQLEKLKCDVLIELTHASKPFMLVNDFNTLTIEQKNEAQQLIKELTHHINNMSVLYFDDIYSLSFMQANGIYGLHLDEDALNENKMVQNLFFKEKKGLKNLKAEPATPHEFKMKKPVW